MGKSGFASIVLLLVAVLPAGAQVLPNPLPEKLEQAHAWALADTQYPSAKVCGECHPRQFEQWSISSHAYANLSPMFNKFEQKINDLASGTISHFCVRCHASVGTALGERREIAWWDRAPAAREGITCVTCHRVGDGYGKTNAARRITPGDIHEPVFGPFDSTGGIKAISNAMKWGILVSPDQPDREGFLRIHQAAIQSDFLAKSEFCVSCHQVQVHPGIKLETVWEEYRSSPAAKAGLTCQDCHMSTSPGQPSGFATGPAAVVNGFSPRMDRPLTDHSFIGPGYPISHPGLFPFRMEESPFTPQQWLTFDYRAEWGSPGFEANVPATTTFPAEWRNPADRKKAWTIVQENYERWKWRRDQRRQLLTNASKLEGPFFTSPPQPGKDFAFEYKLTNMNTGHNLPSGSLGAQPELWINVSLVDSGGAIVWESGYVDSHGDMADLQSADVKAGKIPFDHQLVNMQAKFITTNVKGTDREMYLPINLDVDQLPFIRPGGTPNSVMNHPPGARMEKRSIPPLGTRTAKYKVDGRLLTKPGPYKLAIRLRGRTEPIYFMEFVGATRDMIRAENEWADDTHMYLVEIGGSSAAAEDGHKPEMSSGATYLGELHDPKGYFGPDPSYEGEPYDAQAQLDVYGAKHPNTTAQPLIQQGIRLYDRGAYTPRPTWLGTKNPIGFHFMSYGDLRVAAAMNSFGNSDQSSLAARLNLDFDVAFTATERIHAFVRPLDKGGSFTRYQFEGGEEGFVDEFDFDLDTLFFEGDLGAITQGITNRTSMLDLPFAFGRVPLLTQNGIWIEDTFDGLAFSITAKNNPRFDISNMDLTVFAGFDQVTTAAVPGSDAKMFGLAGFADAFRGYVEVGYGYVDAADRDFSYHNLTASFTKRYFGRVSNSIRLIGNIGQSGPVKTADGLLLLVENSFHRRDPLKLVPYLNLFAGFDSPQSLARGADSGGVLRNTGIAFESDGMTGYPTLDASARESYGGSLGVGYLFNLDQQIVLEGSTVQRMGSSPFGSEYSLGVRYQRPISNAWIIRFDAMHGWIGGADNISGVRAEIRRKF